MTNGDAAAAAGMDVVAEVNDLRKGYDEINKSRDYLAVHQATGSHTQTQIIGLPEALNAKQPSLGFAPVEQGGGSGMVGNKIRIGWNGGALLAQVDATPLGAFLMAGGGGSLGTITVDNIFIPSATPAVSGYTAAYINSDGRVSRGASSRRFKQDIKSWAPDQQAILAIQLYTFRYNEAVKQLGTAAAVEVGVMAEDLHELGLSWLVYYDDKGQPEGVHYERIALALLPVVQAHEARLQKLEAAQGGAE